MRRAVLIVFILFLAILIAGCNPGNFGDPPAVPVGSVSLNRDSDYFITGQIIDENGEPVTGYKMAYWFAGGEITGDLITDAEGRFEFTAVPSWRELMEKEMGITQESIDKNPNKESDPLRNDQFRVVLPSANASDPYYTWMFCDLIRYGVQEAQDYWTQKQLWNTKTFDVTITRIPADNNRQISGTMEFINKWDDDGNPTSYDALTKNFLEWPFFLVGAHNGHYMVYVEPYKYHHEEGDNYAWFYLNQGLPQIDPDSTAGDLEWVMQETHRLGYHSPYGEIPEEDRKKKRINNVEIYSEKIRHIS